MALDHNHAPPADLGPAFRWAVRLNTAYVIVEGVAGWITGSLALLADAALNLADVAGLLVALVGIAVNTGSALLFMFAGKCDVNARGVFLHMAADVAVSGGSLLTGWDWLDPRRGNRR